ncbi:hypothetical protein KKE92_05910 [Candidatus Micrarchaeota archaeon]|nr:hypothetical protein [Candidatus Micrarchaeota archaeon]MBU1681591.1 hypothetical protein [Candidatus Micrarchaeota archaeon]
MEELNVAAQIKIYVDDPTALESVKVGIENIAKVQRATEEELGFGIKVLRVNLLLADSEGGMEEIEEKIKALEHVTQVEVEEVGRV